MKIDITQLSEDELVDLHRRITERLRFLSQTRAHHKMLEFKVGDRVSFKRDDQTTLSGVLTRYNKKTVTVITDNGEHWNVSPGLLKLAKDAKDSENKPSNIIPLPKR
jgi:ribosomal protein L21E